MELLEMFGISANCISKAVTELITLWEVDSYSRTIIDADRSTELTLSFKDFLPNFKDSLHLINSSMWRKMSILTREYTIMLWLVVHWTMCIVQWYRQ